MPARRILVGACALALTLPAAAVARLDAGPFLHGQGGITYGSTAYVEQNQRYEAAHQPAAGITYGSPAYFEQNRRYEAAHQPAAGITYGSPAYFEQNRRYAAAHYPASVASAASHVPASATGATSPPASATPNDDGLDTWRIVALAEAGLLAALVLGATALAVTRRRSPVGA